MPLDLQPALLRDIETGRITPLGSDREVEADNRIIAATNRNLEDDVEDGTAFAMNRLRQRLKKIKFNN